MTKREGRPTRRPHPLERITPAEWADLETEAERAYREETARDAAEKAERIREYERSPEQREWEGHDEGCEAEFITEAGQWSPCRCAERAEGDA